MSKSRIGFGAGLERLITVALMLVIAASTYRAFVAPKFASPRLRTFSQLQQVADRLQCESDPVKREDSIAGENKSVDGNCRLLDEILPTNARLFMLDMLGPEKFNKLPVYYYLTYYYYPREVAISLNQPPAMKLDRFTGRKPASLKELKQAGYDFAVKIELPGSLFVLPLDSLAPRPSKPTPKLIPKGDWLLACLLPLAVAITGRRMVRWLFRDLNGILTTGELLASGLAVGAFFLTQLALGLRLAGARWERTLTAGIMVWAAGEVVFWLRRQCALRPRFKPRQLWWLLLVPAGLILWCQFRLAGLLGLQEFERGGELGLESQDST